MGKDVRVLRFFTAVAEELHFGRAAVRLHISQPSLSRAISELETSLGVQLLSRTRRSVVLTEAGRALLEDAPAAVLGVERCFARAQRIGRGELGTLTVGFLPSVTGALLPPAVTAFRAAYPDVHLGLREMPDGSLQRAVHKRAVDIAILRSYVQEPGIRCELLYDDPIDIVVPLSHPHARRRRVCFADLREDGFLLWPRSQSPAGYDRVIDGCRSAGFEPHIVQECVLPNTMLGLVAAGAGVAVLSSLFRTFRTDVAFIPLRDHPRGSIHLAWSEAPPSILRDALVAMIRDARTQVAAASVEGAGHHVAVA